MKNTTHSTYFSLTFLTIFFITLIFCCFDFKNKNHQANHLVIETFIQDEFEKYWYQGKAEITSYQLEQARYGEMRAGEAILVFVTEDFLTDKQVKFEKGNAEKAVSVLKLNFIKKFITGIYDYSMMMSVFTPVNASKNPQTLKITTTSQEWCGHTYQQLNWRKNKYQVQGNSYFQNEADENYSVTADFTEDEIWARIRIAPDKLPLGNIELIPATMASRLRHIALKTEKAMATLAESKGDLGEELKIYTLQYPENQRTLKITFEKKFPYQIIAWEETYKDGWGANAQILTTKAKKNKQVMTDYWTKNHNQDQVWREKLGLK